MRIRREDRRAIGWRKASRRAASGDREIERFEEDLAAYGFAQKVYRSVFQRTLA
jgi:hypothetical protein